MTAKLTSKTVNSNLFGILLTALKKHYETSELVMWELMSFHEAWWNVIREFSWETGVFLADNAMLLTLLEFLTRGIVGLGVLLYSSSLSHYCNWLRNPEGQTTWISWVHFMGHCDSICSSPITKSQTLLLVFLFLLPVYTFEGFCWWFSSLQFIFFLTILSSFYQVVFSSCSCIS